MRRPRRWEVAACALCVAVAGLVGLAILFAGDATYEEIARREAIGRELFRAPAGAGPTEGVTYPLGTLVGLHRATLAYVLGETPALPPSPTRGAFYTEDEARHLADVRALFAAARAAMLVAFGGLSLLLVRAARRGAGVALARDGAVAAGVGVAALGALAAFAFEPAFLAFHGLFFPQGNFLFDPETSNLLRLYPFGYWYGATLRVAVTFLAAVGLVAAASTVALRFRSPLDSAP